MKLSKKQLIKLIKEFKDLGGDSNFNDLDLTSGAPPNLPPVEGDDEGGPSKNWPMEVINRLKRIGYHHFVRRDGKIPFKNQVVKKMIDPDVSLTIDALQEGVVIAVNYGKGEHKVIHTAGQKFVQVHNGMDTNKATGIVVAVAKAIKNRRSEDIQNDLNRLKASGIQDQEQFTMEDFLNSRAFLIDYYSQQGRK